MDRAPGSSRSGDAVRWSLVVLVVVPIGCGGSDPAAVALQDVPAAYAAAFCERVFACCETAELDVLLPNSGVSDRSECEAHVARVFGNEFVADMLRAQDLSRADYDAVAMATCIDHVRRDGCDHLARVLRLMTVPRDCAPARRPHVEIGGACDHDFHCESGVCASTGEHVDGRCVAVPGLGAPCAAGDCGPDAYCDRGASQAGTCEPIVGVGLPCRTALGCESLSCLDGTCAPPVCDGV